MAIAMVREETTAAEAARLTISSNLLDASISSAPTVGQQLHLYGAETARATPSATPADSTSSCTMSTVQ